MTRAASARRLPTGPDNKYVIARGNAFGYANYEIIPKVVEVNSLGGGEIPPLR